MPLPKKMPKSNGKSKSKDVERVFANRYRLEKRLGSGSFGTVFLVEDMHMKTKGDWKVLKEIHVGELPPDETVDAMREARLLSNLDHPNIVKFLDSFPDREFFCIVTEYCEGGDLDDKIKAWKKAGKKFDESLILVWFIQLVLAVQYMHSKRILHRDLKTRGASSSLVNIIRKFCSDQVKKYFFEEQYDKTRFAVVNDGHRTCWNSVFYLMEQYFTFGDFGISRILMGTSDMATTFTGTPYYMSPEALKHEGYNSKSDIWSLGVVLYELCNLEHAFKGQNLMGVMYKIVEGTPPELAEGYSEELRELYAQMLEKDPNKRPTAANVTKNSYVAQNMKRLKLKLNEMPRGDASLSLSKSSRTERKKERGKLYQEPEGRPLTPMDRLKLRKQQKADEEAEKLKQYVVEQAAQNRAKSFTHKKKQNRVSLPWVQEHPDVFNDPTFTVTLAKAPTLSPSPPTSPRGYGDIQQPISSQESGSEVDEDLSLSLTGDSDIPEDAELAETFYSQFEDEFEDDEEFSSGEEEEQDYSALVGHMEDALESSGSWGPGAGTLPEETISEGMSGSLRQRRIEGLRAECEKLLGQEAFERAYKYLKDVRFGDDLKDEDSIMDGLGKIVDKPRDCFLVDQLLFMEKQAEIAAMT